MIKGMEKKKNYKSKLEKQELSSIHMFYQLI